MRKCRYRAEPRGGSHRRPVHFVSPFPAIPRVAMRTLLRSETLHARLDRVAPRIPDCMHDDREEREEAEDAHGSDHEQDPSWLKGQEDHASPPLRRGGCSEAVPVSSSPFSLSGLRGSCRTSARSRFASAMPFVPYEVQSLHNCINSPSCFVDPGFPSPRRQKRWRIMRSTHAGRNTLPESPSQSPRSAAWFALWAVRSGGERTRQQKQVLFPAIQPIGEVAVSRC